MLRERAAGSGGPCAQALSDAGARVILAARDAEKLEEAAMQIPRATCVAIDLASPESIKEAFAKAGKIDILVNNAGITKDGLAMRMKKEDWDAVLATNLTGAFLAIQQVLPVDAQRALGPDHQHLVDRRARREIRASRITSRRRPG